MNRKKMLFTLIKQELRQFSRSKGIIIFIVIVPLIIWTLQIGMLYIDYETPQTYSGESLYVYNLDAGNVTHNYGELLIDYIDFEVNNENSRIYNLTVVEIEGQYSYDEISDRVLGERISPLIYIPENFTSVYNDFQDENSITPKIKVISIPEHIEMSYDVQNTMWQIVYSYPFRIADFDSITYVNRYVLTAEGEDMDNTLQVFFVSFLSLYMALFAAGPIVSTSFAGERVNKTMESLLALPMRDIDILLGKFIAGGLLLTIFSIMNVVGMIIYGWVLNTFDLFPGMNTLEISGLDLLILFIVTFSVTITALCLCIAITSSASDKKTAETGYNMAIAMPYAIIAVVLLINGLPTGFSPLYLIPWTHANAIMVKGLFPNSELASTFTAYIWMDILVHILVMFAFVLVSFLIVIKIRSRIFMIRS